MPKILIKSGEKKGLAYHLSDEEITIGRFPTNNIVLADNRVSRVHASIELQDGKYTIKDLGSVNGTYVNNELITRQELTLNDEIKLGSTLMKFLSQQSPEDEKVEEEISRVHVLVDEEKKGLTVEHKVKPEKIKSFDEISKSDVQTQQKTLQKLTVMYELSHELGAIVDLSKLLKRVVELAMQIIKADRAFILFKDNETGELVLQVMHQKEDLSETEEITISKTVTSHVLDTGEAILTSDAMHDDRFKQAESIIVEGIRSTMCVPIKYKDKILGVMLMDTKGNVGMFTEDDLELLTAICSQAAVAIESAKLFEDLKRAHEDLKQHQRQLIEAEKLSAIGQLASGVAHEINNPMTTILGYAELSGRELSKDDLSGDKIKECVEFVGIIESEANRCQSIVQSLLQFSRRKKSASLVPVDVNHVVEASLTIAKFHIKGPNIKIIKKLSENLPKVLADMNQLQQVFLNMIVNARDAIEKNGEVTITTALDGDWVTIQFSDTGCGIDEDKLEEIFKPLFTTKPEGKGTGLGLSITHDIVERHNGIIEVDSEKGKGTTFTIKLPVGKGQ